MPANRREFWTHFVLQIPSLGKSRAGAAIPRQSTDSIADKSGRIHRKSADFSRNHSRASLISQDTPAALCLTRGSRSLAEKPGRRNNGWQQAAERNVLGLVCVFVRGAHAQSPRAGAQTDLWWSLAASAPGHVSCDSRSEMIFRPPHAITRQWPQAALGAPVTPPEGQCAP